MPADMPISCRRTRTSLLTDSSSSLPVARAEPCRSQMKRPPGVCSESADTREHSPTRRTRGQNPLTGEIMEILVAFDATRVPASAFALAVIDEGLTSCGFPVIVEVWPVWSTIRGWGSRR